MKKILLLTFLIPIVGFSQSMTKDGIQISIKKTRLAQNASSARQLQVDSDKLKKVLIRTKIKSNLDDKTKLSAFSLLDTKNKIRYRLAEYKGSGGFMNIQEFIPYRKTEFYHKNGSPIQIGIPYDKSEKDYFNDYDIEGYENFETPINFGTKKNPKLSVVYFGETSYKKIIAELFFVLLAENISLDYELYYKNEKIADVKF